MVVKAHSGVPILRDGAIRAWVVGRARAVFDESGATCLGWAILSNHFHVLVRCDGPPGPAFARLNTALAWRARRESPGLGAVLQNRFWSQTCDDRAALLNRLAYVLGNPLHHRVVRSVDALIAHEWSGLGEVLGLREPLWCVPDSTLALLHPNPDHARAGLVELIQAKAVEWANDGGSDDVDRGLRWKPADVHETTPDGAPSRDVPAAAAEPVRAPAASSLLLLRNELLRDGWTPARLLPVVCEMTGASVDDVRRGTRTSAASVTRSIAAHVACDVVGIPMVEVAPTLGVAPSTLSGARSRGRQLLSEFDVAAATLIHRSRGPSSPLAASVLDDGESPAPSDPA